MGVFVVKVDRKWPLWMKMWSKWAVRAMSREPKWDCFEPFWVDSLALKVSVCGVTGLLLGHPFAAQYEREMAQATEIGSRG